MKKSILSLLLLAILCSLNAQQMGKIRVGLDAGFDFPHAGFGFGGGLDVRYNVMDNVNLGLKFSGDVLMKDLVMDQVTPSVSITTSAVSSTLATSDYYFGKGTSAFSPFLGGGLGFYKVSNIRITAAGTDTPTPPSNTSSFRADTKFGALLRGGFELGHMRLGLEYYLVPKSTAVDLNNDYIGTTGNSFMKLSLGFYLGGGKWRKY